MTDLTTAESLRLSALDGAARTAALGETAEEVTKRAEAYLAFLTGRAEPAQGATAEPKPANTIHVHLAKEDPEREPGEAGRRKRLVRDIIRALRGLGYRGAAEWVDLTYGETR